MQNNMSRKLASIQKILSLDPIDGADSIEVATVLGWHTVVKKGEFKVGDLCIFFEVDSLLPIHPAFDFLKSAGIRTILDENLKEHSGYRLKTIRLRGQISQGLALPITSFSDILKIQDIWKEGKDVTKKLGVVKYERYIQQNNMPKGTLPIVFPNWLPVKLGMFLKRNFPKLAVKLWGKNLNPFPSFIPKTDEPRIHNFPNILPKYKDTTFYTTEKLDGSSITLFHNKGDIGVCSRNIRYPKDLENSFWKPIILLGIEDKLKKLGNYALQGELVGEGIQGNKLKLKGTKVFFFNAFNIDTFEYLSYKEFKTLTDELGIQTVPIIEDRFKLPETVDEMVKFATTKSKINPEVWAEGVVVRPLVEIRDTKMGRLSFKAINPEFLLEYGE